MIYSLAACAAGFFLDLLIGDPAPFHPVMAIGWLITTLEKLLRKIFPKTKKGELVAGIALVILVSLISTGIPFLLIVLFYRLHPAAGFAFEAIICYVLLATKSLKTESMKVYDALKKGTIEEARYAVSMIVGRDTKQLDEEGVIKAAVETIAENTSDGSIAPMFYMILFGPVFGFFYKAVNTMDSMVGYKNDKYLYFGRAAAVTDDILNYIPARICALFMLAASFLLKMPVKQAWNVYKRDRYQHASPNSAHTEAVMAGALRVMLAGDAWYFGKKHKKPTIGDDLRKVVRDDIVTANRMLYLTAVLGLIIISCIKLLFAAVFYGNL